MRGTVTVPDCRLDPATAHLWTIDVEALDEPAFASLAAPLSEEEQDRASRFRFPRDRRTFVAAHGLVRQALSWAMPGVAPQDWRFAATREGRPEIAAPAVVRRPRFNLSSSAGRVACVVTADSDCGVDLQAMSGLRDLDLLSGNVLAAAERGEMAALPDDQRLERFFRLWTLKEAYAKACGLGALVPFDRLAFSWRPDEIVLNAGGAAETAPWHFRQWLVAPMHMLAVAVRAAAFRGVVSHGAAEIF